MKKDLEEKSKITSTKKEIEDCITQWTEVFGLTDWNITYDLSGRDDSSNATMHFKILPRSAHIIFNENLKDYSPVIIHELIHLLMADIEDYVKDLVDKNIPKNQQEFILSRYDTLLEIFTHKISQIF